MLMKYFKDDYSSGRKPVDIGLLESILKEVLKISSNVELEQDEYKKIILLLMSGINYYLYLHPEQYIDFGKFVAYRSVDLKNLLTVEAKSGENARSIYEYYKNGGLQAEEIKKLVEEYAFGLLDESLEKSKKLDKDVNNIRSLISHDEQEITKKHKEKKNGI